MTQAKFVFSIFTVSLAVAALASTNASAEGWMVGETQLSGSAQLAATAKLTETAKLSFSTVAIECSGSTLAIAEGFIAAPSGGGASSVTFTGCKLAKTKNCTLASTEIGTVPISLSGAKLEGALAVGGIFTPTTKSTFATVEFVGETCGLLGLWAITGKVKFASPDGQDERSVQPMSLSTAAGDLKVGSDEATLTGATELGLRSGGLWSFL